MPPPQDRFEVNLELVTVAGTEYTMQANLTHYEDIAELEDDILCFLPTVSELDVFGCELELLNLQTQRPLPEAFRTELLHRPQLQIVVRPCIARTGWGPSEACAEQGEVDPRGSGGTLNWAYSAGELLMAPVPNEP